MKYKVLLVLLAMVLVVSLASFVACAKEEEAPPVEEEAPPVEEEAPPVEEEAPPVEEVWEWPDMISVLAGPVETVGYGMILGWTSIMAKDTGIQVRCVPTEAGPTGMRWLKQGQFVFGAPGETKGVMEGSTAYATRDLGPWDERVMWPSSKTVTGWVVRGDSGINTPHDIKPGMKLAYLSAVKYVFEPVVAAMLAWGEVDPETIEWVPASTWNVMWQMLTDGKVDFTYGMPAAPGMYEAEATPHGIAWIQFDAKADQEGAKRYLEFHSTAFGINEAGVPSSIDMKGLVTLPTYITGYGADTELIYHICRWLGENFDQYQEVNPMMRYYSIGTVMEMVETSYLPAHDGLIKYLKEIGRWTPAHDARQEANLEQANRYIEAYQEAIDMADEQGIKVDPENEEWMQLWENHKKKLNLPEFKNWPGL